MQIVDCKQTMFPNCRHKRSKLGYTRKVDPPGIKMRAPTSMFSRIQLQADSIDKNNELNGANTNTTKAKEEPNKATAIVRGDKRRAKWSILRDPNAGLVFAGPGARSSLSSDNDPCSIE